jgi:MFS family permease
VLLSPYAGLLVDRYAKRRVLPGTQAGLGLVLAALGAAVLAGDIRLWQVVVLAVLFGILSAVDNPARQAFVQEVVGHDLVRNAATLKSTSVNVARVIGPTIAAALVSTVGIGWCFVVNAVSFGFVIVSLLSLDTRRLHPVPPVPRGRGQLRAGLRYAVGVPAIIRPLLMMALVGTFTFEFEVSLPLLAETTFHGTSTTYSALIGALGAGAVAGGLYAARSARTGVARLIRAALGYAVAVGLVAAAPTLATAIAACVLVGVASVIFLTTGNATIQLASDPEYRGRVTALWSMAGRFLRCLDHGRFARQSRLHPGCHGGVRDGAAGERHPLTPHARHFYHGLYRHLRRPGKRPRYLGAPSTLGAAPDRDPGWRGRRRLPR